ncbi:MAG: NUDIX hydrolase [Candidatus Margulisiibacteriota bacterium]
MIEKTLSSEVIYKGRILDLRVDTVVGPNGITKREIIDHAPAVTILPFHSKSEIFLVHQFRKAIDQVLIEAPAGCIEYDENPELAAHRELKEETGFSAANMIKVAEMYMAPGFCNEYMSIFLATQLTVGKTNFDHDEVMELKQYSLDQLEVMIKNHQIIDAKTIVAVQYLKEYFNGF